VARIPEATPRYSAGTLDVIEEEFGELYIPIIHSRQAMFAGAADPGECH
jgi:hypothetical protein